ncbi:hypothetical protein HPB51_015485 [Rhipicephalus microplus]|uniref:Uncharacterized protein n=1 Tax=Rhipicephalus microplus TaxID=6941 RepID=A0A9J6F435_RHIMP|nr:hypothetical protein HPB51_015485 [Rhipicephalus microplus]
MSKKTCFPRNVPAFESPEGKTSVPALLFAVPPPIGLAPTGSKPPGVLWYGYSVRTGAADIRVDDVAQVAPPNSRTTRYTSAIAHGGALSRVDVALGTPHGSVVYYNDNPPADVAARLFSPNYPGGVPPLVPFPQGYVQSFGPDGPPVPTQRFIGQVDHSERPLPISSLGPRIGARALPSVPLVAQGAEDRPPHQPPFSAIVRSRPVLSQPVGPVVQSHSPLHSPHQNQPQFTTNKAAVITLVVTPGSSPALGTTQGVEAAEVINARLRQPQLHAPFRLLSRKSQVLSHQTNTSQSQDTSSVVKNQIKTPVVLNNGRGQYDFRGYEQFEGQPGAEETPEAPEDSRTSKKYRHNFRVS